MKKALMLSLFVLFGISTTFAQTMVMVGGEDMSPKKDIVDNAVNSANHTTLVAAVKAAGLVQTLKSDGPFTVFAPTNDAFENLPEGTVETLLKPENKKKLTNILTFHVVPGNITYEAAAKAIEKGNGKAKLKTASGGTLTAMWNGKHNIVIKDEQGNTANITTYNVDQSNGVIHVIDSVLLPADKMKKDNMMEEDSMEDDG
jgi:uncharacterized surface protein with fasciclin (FAS1) repeats